MVKDEKVSITLDDEKFVDDTKPKKKPMKVVHTSKELNEAIKISEKGDTILFDEAHKYDNLTLTQKENEELKAKIEMMENRFQELAEKIDNRNQLVKPLLTAEKEVQEKIPPKIEISPEISCSDTEEENPLDKELDLLSQNINQRPTIKMKEEKKGLVKKICFWKKNPMPKKSFEVSEEEPEEKEVILHSNEDFNMPTRCPLCDSKVKKSFVKRSGNIAIQVYKCKNPVCTFVKEFKFKVQNY